MEEILDAPQSSEEKANYAGFWVRVLAYFIDIIILTVSLGILIGVIAALSGMPTDGMFLIALYLIFPLYFIMMESSEKQTTIGKAVMGIYVGDESGNRVSTIRAAGRLFGKFISYMFLGIGFLMVGWDSKKQGLHDKIAGTYVMYK